MTKIAIVYHTQSGTTGLLAEAVARGAQQVPGVHVLSFQIRGEQFTEGRWHGDDVLKQLVDADTIIFGAPTLMGGPSAPFKAFADATGYTWYQRGWKDKFAAGFTISNSPAGDKLNTLNYFSILAAQHGMVWINSDELPMQQDGTNRLGSYLGLTAQNGTAPGNPAALAVADQLAAEKFGLRIAAVSQRLAPGGR